MAALSLGDSRRQLALGVWLVVILLCVLPLVALLLTALGNPGHTLDELPIAALLAKSILLTGSATVAAVALGSVLALLLLRTQLPGRLLLLALFTLPLFIPSYIHAVSWSKLLAADGGLSTLTTLLAAEGIQQGLSGEMAAWWVYVVSYSPVALLIVAAGVLHWDQRFQEAGLLHASPTTVWRGVHWRFLRGYVAVAGFLTFFLMFSDFGVPDYFQVQVYAAEVFIQLSAYLDTAAAIVISLPPLALGLLLLYLLLDSMRRVTFGARDGGYRASPLLPLGHWRGGLTILTVGILAVLVILPLGQVVSAVGSLDMLLRAVNAGWRDGLTGAGFALVASLLAMGAGLFAGYVVSRRVTPLAAGLRWIALSMWVLPAALIALGYISLWNQPGIAGATYLSGMALMLALAARVLPLAVEVSTVAWSRLPASQEEAAFVSGAAFAPAFRTVLLPRLRGTLMTGGLVTFILVFNELGMAVLLAPPGVSTLPLRIFSTVHYGPEALVAAMCLFQILILAVPIGLLFMTVYRHVKVVQR